MEFVSWCDNYLNIPKKACNIRKIWKYYSTHTNTHIYIYIYIYFYIWIKKKYWVGRPGNWPFWSIGSYGEWPFWLVGRYGEWPLWSLAVLTLLLWEYTWSLWEYTWSHWEYTWSLWEYTWSDGLLCGRDFLAEWSACEEGEQSVSDLRVIG